MTDTNPLLEIRQPIPFDAVAPEHVGPALKRLIDDSRARIDAIATLEGPRTFANTMLALDLATEPLDFAVAVVRHLENVATTPELRQAWNEAQPEVAAFYSSIPLHSGLWAALKAYSATGDSGKLNGVAKRFLDKTIDSFRRHGADLDDAGKKRLSEIDVELAQTTTKFAQNVLDATAKFEVIVEDEAELAGLPPSAVDAARQSAAAKGMESGWRFTLQQPSYLAVMTYLDDAARREEFWRAYNWRAAEENGPLIERILALRREKAQLLGYSQFADFVLTDRMAKTGATAYEFVRGLGARTQAAFAKENAALSAFANAELHPWDVGYWAEKQRSAQYAFDEEDLRPYFPMERVIAGMFELVRRLYGVTVAEAPGIPAWHEDVKHYELRGEDGAVLGSFYADWFPRDTKRGGAWMDSFLSGRTIGDQWRPHVGLMCGNMTPPVGDRPALLTHREVETVFHEFGHLLHQLLSRVEIRSFAGTSVAWDFVELPSQIMENWCWERESLDLFAAHYQTGEPLPEELFQKMRRARTYRSANAQMRQLGFATVDLSLHMHYDRTKDGDVIAHTAMLLKPYAAAPLPDGYAMIAGFTHLFADAVGYGAGYYSYKWAEVLDADAFSRFRDEGLFNRETGLAFRRCILEKGDSEDPAKLFRDFMGRGPDPEALLRRLGLAQ